MRVGRAGRTNGREGAMARPAGHENRRRREWQPRELQMLELQNAYFGTSTTFAVRTSNFSGCGFDFQPGGVFEFQTTHTGGREEFAVQRHSVEFLDFGGLGVRTSGRGNVEVQTRRSAFSTDRRCVSEF